MSNRLINASFLLQIFFIHSSFADLQFHKTVPAEKMKLIQSDLQLIRNLEVLSPDHSLPVFDQEVRNGSDLERWFKERVHFVIWEDYDVEKNIKQNIERTEFPKEGDKNPYAFARFFSVQTMPFFKKIYNQVIENKFKEKNVLHSIQPRITPSSESVLHDQTSELKVMGENLGSLYRLGKEESKTYSFLWNDNEKVKYDSTRVGLMRIGKNLMPDTNVSENYAQRAIRRAFRLSVLFHEARHSDGNGENANFPHVLCPMFTKNELDFVAACDVASNGAYEAGSEVIQIFLNNSEQFLNAEATEVEKKNTREFDISRDEFILANQALLADSESRRVFKNGYYGRKVDSGSLQSKLLASEMDLITNALTQKMKMIANQSTSLNELLFQSNDFEKLQLVLEMSPPTLFKEKIFSDAPESAIDAFQYVDGF